MLLLVVIVWWTAPLAILAGLVAHSWLEIRRERRFEEAEARLLAMHERHAVSVLRPNGSVEHVVPVSRRRDGGAA